MAMARPSMRGASTSRPSAAITTSSMRLIISAQADLAVELNSSIGSPASSSIVTAAMERRRKSGSSQASMPSISHCRSHSSIRASGWWRGRRMTASMTREWSTVVKSSNVPGAARPSGGARPGGGRKPTISKNLARSG